MDPIDRRARRAVRLLLVAAGVQLGVMFLVRGAQGALLIPCGLCVVCAVGVGAARKYLGEVIVGLGMLVVLAVTTMFMVARFVRDSGGARLAAQVGSAGCAQNLREIGRATLAYVADHDGFLPPAAADWPAVIEADGRGVWRCPAAATEPSFAWPLNAGGAVLADLGAPNRVVIWFESDDSLTPAPRHEGGSYAITASGTVYPMPVDWDLNGLGNVMGRHWIEHQDPLATTWVPLRLGYHEAARGRLARLDRRSLAPRETARLVAQQAVCDVHFAGPCDPAKIAAQVAQALGGDVERLTQAGTELLYLGEADAAVKVLKQAVAARPDAAAQYRLAEALLTADRLDEAIEPANRAIELAPDQVGAREVRSVILARLDRWAEAAEDYRTLCDLQPQYPTRWNALAEALVRAERWSEADAAFAQAVTASGGGTFFEFDRVLVALRSGDAAALEAHYQRLKAAAPEDWIIPAIDALRHEEAGRTSQALTAYVAAVQKTDPHGTTRADELLSRAVRLAAAEGLEAEVEQLFKLAREHNKLTHELFEAARQAGGKLSTKARRYRLEVVLDWGESEYLVEQGFEAYAESAAQAENLARRDVARVGAKPLRVAVVEEGDELLTERLGVFDADEGEYVARPAEAPTAEE